MAVYEKDAFPTSASLLRRVKDVQDQASWKEFDGIYRSLIFSYAMRAGLTREEAEDAVQETFSRLVQKLPGFKYDPARGSFKAWLRRLTHDQVVAQYRRRPCAGPPPPLLSSDEITQTTPQQRIPDSTVPELERIWDEEWAAHLLRAAEDKVRRLVEPRQFQLYDLYVNKGWSPEKVAGLFRVNVDQVYLAKSRVLELMREKAKALELKAL